MSWSFDFTGTKQEVKAKLAAVNPKACGASGEIEQGDVAMVVARAMVLVEALDIETPAADIGAHDERVHAMAMGSHTWRKAWDVTSGSPEPFFAQFQLRVSRA